MDKWKKYWKITVPPGSSFGVEDLRKIRYSESDINNAILAKSSEF